MQQIRRDVEKQERQDKKGTAETSVDRHAMPTSKKVSR